MPEFEKQYELFLLTTEKCDNLRWLADSRLDLPRTTDRVLIETVIVDNGERRVLKQEEQYAKLV